jgi:hypothetical protein
MNDLILLLYLKRYLERSRLSGAQMGCKGKEVEHVCNCPLTTHFSLRTKYRNCNRSIFLSSIN